MSVRRCAGTALLPLALVVAGLVLAPAPGDAAESFFQGKAIRIVVGYTPGGGFDAYTRVIARHMSKHIPGNPAIVVENMPGAGSLIAANNIYSVAKPDGLTVGNFISTLIMGQVLGQEGVNFDVRKFEMLGSPIRETMVMLCNRKAGITGVDKLMSADPPIKVGGTAFGDMSYNAPQILASVIPLPIKVVEGYKGTAEIRLAVESGEVSCAFLGWESAKPSWHRVLESGDAVVVLQLADKPHADLPKVPVVGSLARSDDDRQLIKLSTYGLISITRLYALPPGTPKDRVRILRQAFQDTLKDKEFLAEAEKARIDVNPVSAEEIEEITNGLSDLKPPMIGRLKGILLPKK